MPGELPTRDASDSEPGGAPADWGVGLVLGNYTLVRRLGVGGMAEVYEAEHALLRSRAAIKRLHTRPRARPESTARFLREGRAAAAIRHPHVVQVFDVGARDGAPYLVMEFLDGEDLEQHIAQRGALAVGDAIDLMLPVLSAVKAAHDSGMIHRDLKPANVMLARDPNGRVRPVVVDFGIVSATRGLSDGVVTDDDALLGTPAYLAPEQCRGAARATAASDQYALGVILYQCLTGRRPFDEPSLPLLFGAIDRNQIQPLRSLRADVSEALEDAVRQSLAREPTDRHADVAAFAHALLPFASTRGRARWDALEASTGDKTHAAVVPAGEPEAVTVTPAAGTPVIGHPPTSPSRAWVVAVVAGAALALGATALRPGAPARTNAPVPARVELVEAVAAPAPTAPSVPEAPPAPTAPTTPAPDAPVRGAARVSPAARAAAVRRPNHPRSADASVRCTGPNGVNLCL